MKHFFAMPYAIGSSSIYYDLKNKLPILHPVEYPGHGCRIDECCLMDIKDIAKDVFQQIRDYTEEAYGLLGYSMGSLVTYELYKIICREGLRLPELILLLACDTPGVKRPMKGFHRMSKEELKEEILLLNGTCPSVLEEEEIMDLIYPIAKADLAAIENYRDTDPIRIKVPTLVVRGKKEEMLDDSIDCWSHYCEQNKRFLVDGGHFFLFNDPKVGQNLLHGLIQA